MTGEDTTRFPVGILAAIAAFAVYSALLNNFLRFNEYPLLRLEVLYCILAGAGFAAVLGTIYHFVGLLPDWASRVIRAILLGSLVVYAVGLASGFKHGLLAGGMIAAAAFFVATKVLDAISLVAALTLVVASLGAGQQIQSPSVRNGELVAGDRSKPAIVHIIFDAHIGVEGLPGENPQSVSLKRAIQTFYATRGFRLFGGAYSQDMVTAASIPFVLNFAQGSAAKDNAYFKMLRQSGYRIGVLQSEWIDYCSSLVDQCTTYQSQNYASVADAPLTAAEKATLLIRKMVPSKLRDAGVEVYLALAHAGYPVRIPRLVIDLVPTPLNSLNALRLLDRDLTELQPGQVYFAHILLPHTPYSLRSDCSVSPISEWRQSHASDSLRERQNAYGLQAVCLLKQLDLALGSVGRSPAARNVIVIVHGDHGSRVTDVDPTLENFGRFSDKELVASYSTLFAVRGPGLKPGYDPRHHALANLLHELVASEFRTTGSHPAVRPTVYIRDQSLIRRRPISLPTGW